MTTSPPPKVLLHFPIDGVALLEFSDPDSNNAFGLDTLGLLSTLLDQVTADDSVRAIVIAGQGKHFSRGASPELMGALRDASPVEVLANVYTVAQGAVRRIYTCGKPTVAAVSGAAVTIGCELALACDFRIIDETASFTESWIRLGLLPPLGGMFLLPRMVGMARASEMILQGRRIKADEASKIGLANELVSAEQLRGRALDLAAELAALPPQAYSLAKLSFHRALESTLENEWSANAMAQSILMSTEDFAEGISSLQDGRDPNYVGR
ncbi:MAG TPA: enoyl-CoA hydratase/isomerase family protein [Ilumatobacter sp.]|nr:enoyl-CoA hydratase/isomerase family protein [Ilumatobacter sp.]